MDELIRVVDIKEGERVNIRPYAVRISSNGDMWTANSTWASRGHGTETNCERIEVVRRGAALIADKKQLTESPDVIKVGYSYNPVDDVRIFTDTNERGFSTPKWVDTPKPLTLGQRIKRIIG